ncbi:MAG: phosphate acyltransferase [Deltaproteobacteria bacterium]|nr:phosphate acyltransferase [Deltaproteobacteria bacterium]
MIRTFKEIRDKVKSYGKKFFIVIPAADDEISIETALDAKRNNLAESVLIGDKVRIIEILREQGGTESDFEIINCEDYFEAGRLAVRLCREGRADILLKGHLDTALLLKAVLDKNEGLRTERLLSDIFIFEDPLWDSRGGKLVGITDGGITPLPNLEQKRQMLENAVEVFKKLGYNKPKVAVMSATEKPNEKIPSTWDAKLLVEMYKRGEIKDCIVEGPMALDVAAHRWCAELKGIKSEIAGEVDIMLMPSFEAANMVAKVFVFYMNRQIGHVIKGASVPVLINSRTDSAQLKINSIALSILTSLQ